MLKRILFCGITALLISACAPQSTGKTPGLGEEFTLSIGQSASIAGEQLGFKFLEIVGDSRCPTGATCVWQGEVSVQVEITSRGTTFTKILTQPGLTNEPSTAQFNDYRIAFDVLPYPEVEKQIPKGDYRLQLSVSR